MERGSSGKLCKDEKCIYHLFCVIKNKTERKKFLYYRKKITSAVTINKALTHEPSPYYFPKGPGKYFLHPKSKQFLIFLDNF